MEKALQKKKNALSLSTVNVILSLESAVMSSHFMESNRKGCRITTPKSKNFPGKEPNFALNFIMWIEDFQSRGKNMECTKERNTSGTEPSVLQPFIGKY